MPGITVAARITRGLKLDILLTECCRSRDRREGDSGEREREGGGRDRHRENDRDPE